MKEDQNTEFKRNWRDDFLRELCAFANTQGGTLYIGVDDNGTIIGVPKSKELLENLLNKIQSNLGILSQVNLQTHDDKDTIAISVLPQNRPISYEATFIQMRIWDQEIELWNPGTLPHNFTIETLMQKHESCPRNPLIAKVFFLAGFIENWGRGYEKMHHEFAKAGLQQPVFEQLRGGMMATIQREVFLKIRGAQSVIAGTEQPTGNDTGNDRGNDLGKIKLIVCSLNREILRREELMIRMKLRSSSNYRDQYLYPAMAAGYVAMTLPDKPQSKNQKYYLTPKGIELLKQLNAN